MMCHPPYHSHRNVVVIISILHTGFPHNLKNIKLIFQVLEMSLNFAKSGNVLEIILPVKHIHLEQKPCE